MERIIVIRFGDPHGIQRVNFDERAKPAIELHTWRNMDGDPEEIESGERGIIRIRESCND